MIDIEKFKFEEFETNYFKSVIIGFESEPIQELTKKYTGTKYRRYKRTEGKWKGWVSKFYEVKL